MQSTFIDINSPVFTDYRQDIVSSLRYKAFNCSGFQILIRIKDGVILEFRRSLMNILETEDKEFIGIRINELDLFEKFQIDGIVYTLKRKSKNILKEIKWNLDETISRHFICSLNLTERDDCECINIIGIDLSEYNIIQQDLIIGRNGSQELLENAPIGVFKTTISGKFIEVNEYLSKKLGYKTPNELMAAIKSIGEDLYYSNEEREKCLESLKNNQNYSVFTTKFKRRDGGVISMRIVAKITSNEHDQPYIFGFAEDISENERVQRALSESQRFQKSIFDGSADPIVILDLQGRCLDINLAFEKNYGYAASEFIGKKLPDSDIYENGNFDVWIQACRSGNGISGYEYNRKLKDGSSVPVRVTVSPITGDSGELFAVSVWYNDISDIRGAQNRAEDYFNKLLFLQYSATELLTLSSPDEIGEYVIGKISSLLRESIIFYSEVFQHDKIVKVKKISGISETLQNKIMEKLPAHLFDVDVPLSDYYIDKYINEKLVKFDGDFVDYTKGIIDENDADFIAKLLNINDIYIAGLSVKSSIYGSVNILKRGDDNPAEISDLLEAFLNQVSIVLERKSAEQKLLDKENDFISVINFSIDPIMMLDMRGDVLNVNDAGASILKSEISEIIGSNIFDLIGDRHGRIDLYSRDNISEINKLIQFESEYNGVYYDVHVNPIYDKRGKVTRLAIMARDIQKRKEAEIKIKESEAKLKETIEAKDKFFSIISHDLKNPISGFMLLAKTLNNNIDTYTRDELKDLFNIIIDSATNIQNLLNNLLDWAKTQRGAMPFNPTNFALVESVLDLEYVFKSSLIDKNIQLEINIPDDLYVYADFNMIQTVFRNLVSNAIKFSYPKGKIIISANELICSSGNFVQAIIQDFGVGISEKNIAQLFSLERNLTTLGTANEKGSGLGLILCKDFVEKNGGRISVISQQDSGAEFRFLLKPAMSHNYDEILWDELL
jgi:PAS domain S-box-containing protein